MVEFTLYFTGISYVMNIILHEVRIL